jgi:hypothetical protein
VQWCSPTKSTGRGRQNPWTSARRVRDDHAKLLSDLGRNGAHTNVLKTSTFDHIRAPFHPASMGIVRSWQMKLGSASQD